MKSPLLLLSSLLDDFKRLDPSVKGLDRDFVTIEHRFKHEGFSFLAVTLPILCDAFDSGISSGRFACPSYFKRYKKEALPAFTRGLLCKVFDSEGHLRPEAQSYHVKMIREFLRVFKKTQLPPKKEAILSKQAIESFIETDDELADFPIGLFIPRLLSRVSQYVLPNLENFEMDNVRMRHGPGAVYEGVQGNQKWRSLFNDLLSGSFDPSETEMDIFYANHVESFDVSCTLSSGRVSRLVTVPKTSQSVRTITVEPLAKQFVQQGLNTLLRENIARCPILKNCLDLSSQEPNQRLAIEGSISNKWSTVDLSSASDLLDTRLVELVFENKPRFLSKLMASRTPYVDTGDRCLLLRKFAGMGNATTFPVQSVVFSILGICAILDQDGISKPSHRNVRAAARLIQVFGDDIIIRREYVDALERWLTTFKLKLNRGKSFLDGFFKESCGTDAFKGDIVTPTYVRTWPTNRSIEDDSLASLVSTSNQFWMLGLYRTSDTIRKMISRSFDLPLVSSNSASIGYHDRYDSTEVHSWNPHYHCFLVRGLSSKSRLTRDELDGRAALLKFFMTSLIERRNDHLKRSSRRYNTRLIRSWVPA